MKGLKSYLIQKNVKHLKKTVSSKKSKGSSEINEGNLPSNEPETDENGGQSLGKKLGKLESKLESLKSLNGQSFRLCALTIARFDLGIQFTKEDYIQYAEEVSTIFSFLLLLIFRRLTLLVANDSEAIPQSSEGLKSQTGKFWSDLGRRGNRRE